MEELVTYFHQDILYIFELAKDYNRYFTLKDTSFKPRLFSKKENISSDYFASTIPYGSVIKEIVSFLD